MDADARTVSATGFWIGTYSNISKAAFLIASINNSQVSHFPADSVKRTSFDGFRGS